MRKQWNAGTWILLAAWAGAAGAEEGVVTWADPTCGYFAVKLPGDNPAEAYGLFSVKANPVPQVGDVLEGELQAAQEPTIDNRTRNHKHDTIHWANAKSQEQLVRNSPVQCASRWKKKK
jgi:hypothetical protein